MAKVEKKVDATRSEAVKASWLKPGVRESRSTRRTVLAAEGNKKPVEYSSFYKAFVALGLPESKHIKYRGILNRSEDGKLALEFGGKKYRFEIGEVSKPV